MNISDLHLLYDYNYWANKRILDTAAELAPGQLRQRTTFSYGDLRETLIHTLDAEYVWRMICQHDRIPVDSPEKEAFPTLAAIVSYWQNEEREMRAFLNSLADEDLENIVRYEIPDGVRERVLWHCLVHVVNHGTQHRSECAAMLTDFGKSPGDLDFTIFLNTRASQ